MSLQPSAASHRTSCADRTDAILVKLSAFAAVPARRAGKLSSPNILECQNIKLALETVTLFVCILLEHAEKKNCPSRVDLQSNPPKTGYIEGWLAYAVCKQILDALPKGQILF